MRLLKILLITLFISSSLYSAENSERFWLGTFSNKKLTDVFSYWIETQVRYNMNQGSTGQLLYRTGVLQKLNDKQGLGYLYAHIQSGSNKEHRFTLQHTQNYGNFAGFKLSHRARLEARFLEDIDEDGSRFRYLLRADQLNFKKYGLVLWNELFVNLNKTQWNGNDSMDRNRLFIGVKKKIFDSNRIEFGYLNQYVPRDSGDSSEHVLTLYLFF
jgi:hypothetical protein